MSSLFDKEGKDLPEITALSIRLVYSSCTATKEAAVFDGKSAFFVDCGQQLYTVEFDRELPFSVALCKEAAQKRPKPPF